MFPHHQKYWFYERGPVLLKLNERLQPENFQACFFEEFKKTGTIQISGKYKKRNPSRFYTISYRKRLRV